MFSTTTSTTTRLLAGAALTGVIALSLGVSAAAATPSAHRHHVPQHVLHHAVIRTAPSSVSIGTALAWVRGPNGTPIAVSPTTLP